MKGVIARVTMGIGIVCSILSLGTPSFAESSAEDASAVLQQFIAAENTQQWDTIHQYWTVNEQSSIQSFIDNPHNRAAAIGFFNIQSAHITELKELPPSDAPSVVDWDRYHSTYNHVKVFYVGVDYTVQREDEFFYNGVNYRLAVLGMENGLWRIAEFSDAPIATLTYLGQGFHSQDEQNAAVVEHERVFGRHVNLKGELLSTNRVDLHELHKPRDPQLESTLGEDEAILSVPITADFPHPPSTINVLMTKSRNKNAYGCSSNCLQTLNFDHYIKNVLPNEWTDTGLNRRVYQCGAIVVKTFGWYRTTDPWSPQRVTHVTDTSQQYTHGTDGRAETTDAVNAMSNVGSVTATTHQIYRAEYRTGSRGEGSKAIPNADAFLWIKGTYYWIHDQNQSISWTLQYYYDTTQNAKGEPVRLFSYN